MPATMIDRASAADLMQQASGHGSAPMQVAGVLVLHGRPSPDEVRAAIADRIRAVPRLRRRLVRAPFGAGRPVWVDDPAFDAAHHVRSVRCPPPGGEMELLAIAAELLTRALPRDTALPPYRRPISRNRRRAAARWSPTPSAHGSAPSHGSRPHCGW